MNIIKKRRIKRNQKWLDEKSMDLWVDTGRKNKSRIEVMEDLDITLEQFMEDDWRDACFFYLKEYREITASDFKSPLCLAREFDKIKKNKAMGYTISDVVDKSYMQQAYEKKYVSRLYGENGQVDPIKVEQLTEQFKLKGPSREYIEKRNAEIAKMYKIEVKRKKKEFDVMPAKDSYSTIADNTYLYAFKHAGNLFIHEEAKIISIEIPVYYWHRYALSMPMYIKDIHPIYDPKYWVEDEETSVFFDYIRGRDAPNGECLNKQDYYLWCNLNTGKASTHQKLYAMKSFEGKQYIRESLAKLQTDVAEKLNDYSFMVMYGYHNILTEKSISQQRYNRSIYNIDIPEHSPMLKKDGTPEWYYDPKGQWHLQGLKGKFYKPPSEQN